MKKIVTIIGARPQFVKAAVLSKIIASKGKIEEVIIHTGQHYDANMSALFFEEMQIPAPKYNLDIHGLSHGAMTGEMLVRIEEILNIECPHAVLVYGDTNSTLAGALAAKKMDISLIHVEAGLRSFNMKMPEEINRIVTDRISDLLLCPTPVAITNLEREGLESDTARFVLSGDIMKDAVLHFSELSSMNSTILKDLNLHENEFVLATLHRQENTDNREKLHSLIAALEEISKTKRVVLPLHPRTKKMLDKYDLECSFDLIEPVGYLDMLSLLRNCNLVVTDSGGLQKEAFFCKKNCIIIREETEWVELVSNGYALIAGTDGNKILEAFRSYQEKKMNFDVDLYGNNVGETIYSEVISLISNI